MEDDYYNLLAMRYAFEQKLPHLKLLESVTVEEGIEIAHRRRPCLVLTDLKFAGMDGVSGTAGTSASARDAAYPGVGAKRLPAGQAGPVKSANRIRRILRQTDRNERVPRADGRLYWGSVCAAGRSRSARAVRKWIE